MTIYLSGIHYETDLNELDRIKASLLNLGFEILFPDESENEALSWSDRLKLRLDYLQNCCAIYMIYNWKDSIMARIELTAAMSEKKHLCFTIDDIKDLITTLDG